MNGFQLARQIRFLLRERKWEGDPVAEQVFKSNSVRISPADVESFLAAANPGSPMCKINIGRRQSDQQRKGFVAQEIVITLGVQIEGDEVGENAVIGANRVAGKVSSKGRGISEIESEMFAVLEDVNAMNGIQIQGYSTSGIETARLETTSAFAYCEYTFLFYCTTQLTYLAPTSLVATGNTGGTISLTWEPVPLGWSSIAGSGGQIIRYAVGSTAPATYDAGTSGPTVTGVDDSATIVGLGSGTYSVSIFNATKESGASAGADSWSPPTSYTVSVP